MKRRILSIITALALCLSLCPTGALAEEGEPGTVRVSTAEELQAAVADVNSTGGTVTILLTADIDLGSGGEGIVIKKGDVTLDCGGHTLSGSGMSTIVTYYEKEYSDVPDQHPSLTVRNGTVKNSGSSGSCCINNISDNDLTVEKSAAIIAEGKQGRGIYTTGKAINIYGRVAGTSCGISIASDDCELNLYSGAVITGNWQTIKIDVSKGTTINLEGAKAYLNNAEITPSTTTGTGSGVLIICSNHQVSISADGSISCPTCGFREQAAAMVEKDNAAPVYVTSLPDAFKKANSGATVTLLADVSLRGTITLSAGEFTLNLNGKTVSADNQVFALPRETSSLTVEGEGGIVSSGSSAIVVSGGALTVDGGTIQTDSDAANAIDAFSGEVTVNGGHIIARRDANYSAAALYVYGSASAGIYGGTFTGGVGGSGTITLYGGVFESVTPGGASVWTDSSLYDLLGSDEGSRCVFFDGNGNPITGSKLENSGTLTGTVTVKWCDHPQAARGYTITESTHQAVCTICEMELGDPATHVMDLSGTYCTVCGYYPKPVQVVVDGNGPVLATLEEAWNAATAEGVTNATVTLLSDVLDNTPGSSMTLEVPEGKTITLVGDGHSLGNGGFSITGGTLTAENCGIHKGWQMAGGNATFSRCRFNGEFVSGVPAINIAAGTVGFDSCTFTDNLEVYLSSNNARFTDCTFTNVFVVALAGNSTFKGCKMNGVLQDRLPAVGVSGTAEFTDCTINTPTGNCIYVVDETGAAIIHSGTYTAGEGYSALHVASTGKTQLRGGSFSGIEIAGTTGGGASITTTLPDLLGHTETTRYAYYQNGRRVVVPPDGKGFPDPVAVDVCNDHPAEHVTDTLTHTTSCAYCGYTAAAEPCSYAFTSNEGTCSACGDVITVAAAAPGSLIYDGSLKAFTVTVRQGGRTLTAGEDYTVSYTGGTNAGKASLAVTIGQNQGTYTQEFTVQPKPLTVAGIRVEDRVYDGTNQVEITAATLDGAVPGDAVSVNTSGLTGTLSGTDVGTYTAVTLPTLPLTGEKAANYTLTQPAGAMAAKVTISKAPALAPKTGDLAVANGRAYTYTYGLGSLRPDVPAGQSLGSTAVTYELGGITLGDYYTTGAKIEGQTLTLPIQAVDSEAVGEIGTVEVIIHTGNFEDMRAAIHVRSVNKAIPEGAPTLSTSALTYGQALSAITLSGSMKDGSKDVPGTFAWSSPDNRPAVQESYEAAWVFTPRDNTAYAIVNGISAIQVVPAPIADAEITLSETAYRYDSAAHSPSVTSVKLGDVTLTEGADYTVDVPAGTEPGSYTVTVTGRGNYTGTAAVTFTINPVAQVPVDDGRDLRLEVETGLSSVPAGLTGMEAYNTTEKIETALRVQVSEQMPNVGGNISVFDVTLQYKDESGNWQNADPNHFPTEGVTAILPYPAGTGSTGWRFTVQHLISSGESAGEMETLTYTLTADGLRCKFTTLSPVAIGYQEEKAPDEPDEPEKPDKPARPGNSGGGSVVSTYAVTVEKPLHGQLTASPTSAGSGSTVTLTVTPEEGYTLETLTVTDSRGNEVSLTAQGGGKYTFTMPGRSVTVMAAFAPLPEAAEQPCDGGAACPSRAFTDLGTTGTWYHEAVDYVLQNGLMSGHSSGLFGPNDTLTRAQFAQILYNREGKPAVTGGSHFSDVAPGAWCTPAVTWAAVRGIVEGYGGGRFAPDSSITREQLAVMLWRYAGSPAAAGQALPFTDADQVSGYAQEALRWAVENGIVSGDNGRLSPGGPATRAQVAQMLMNFFGER